MPRRRIFNRPSGTGNGAAGTGAGRDSDSTPTSVIPAPGARKSEPQELRGFRLPDNEQPDYPEKAGNGVGKQAENNPAAPERTEYTDQEN